MTANMFSSKGIKNLDDAIACLRLLRTSSKRLCLTFEFDLRRSFSVDGLGLGYRGPGRWQHVRQRQSAETERPNSQSWSSKISLNVVGYLITFANPGSGGVECAVTDSRADCGQSDIARDGWPLPVLKCFLNYFSTQWSYYNFRGINWTPSKS